MTYKELTNTLEQYNDENFYLVINDDYLTINNFKDFKDYVDNIIKNIKKLFKKDYLKLIKNKLLYQTVEYPEIEFILNGVDVSMVFDTKDFELKIKLKDKLFKIEEFTEHVNPLETAVMTNIINRLNEQVMNILKQTWKIEQKRIKELL